MLFWTGGDTQSALLHHIFWSGSKSENSNENLGATNSGSGDVKDDIKHRLADGAFTFMGIGQQGTGARLSSARRQIVQGSDEKVSSETKAVRKSAKRGGRANAAVRKQEGEDSLPKTEMSDYGDDAMLQEVQKVLEEAELAAKNVNSANVPEPDQHHEKSENAKELTTEERQRNLEAKRQKLQAWYGKVTKLAAKSPMQRRLQRRVDRQMAAVEYAHEQEQSAIGADPTASNDHFYHPQGKKLTRRDERIMRDEPGDGVRPDRTETKNPQKKGTRSHRKDIRTPVELKRVPWQTIVNRRGVWVRSLSDKKNSGLVSYGRFLPTQVKRTPTCLTLSQLTLVVESLGGNRFIPDVVEAVQNIANEQIAGDGWNVYNLFTLAGALQSKRMQPPNQAQKQGAQIPELVDVTISLLTDGQESLLQTNRLESSISEFPFDRLISSLRVVQSTSDQHWQLYSTLLMTALSADSSPEALVQCIESSQILTAWTSLNTTQKETLQPFVIACKSAMETAPRLKSLEARNLIAVSRLKL